MFAAGRILRKKDGPGDRQRSAIFGDKSAKTADDLERRKFRCYVPFVWQSVLATVAGFVVMATGITICIVGFYFGHQSQQPPPQPQQPQQRSEEQDRGNDTEVSGAGYVAAGAGAAAAAVAAGSMTSRQNHRHPATVSLISLSYVGPVIMSFGCFAFIFAFVVFCEARDHAIEYFVRSKLYASSKRGPRNSKLPFRRDVIELILSKTRRRAERRARRFAPLDAVVAGTDRCAAEDQLGNNNDEYLDTDRRPSLLPVSDCVDRTADWLLSNGMLDSNDQQPSAAGLNHLGLNETVVSRSSSKWIFSNGTVPTTSSSTTCLDRQNVVSVELNHLGLDQPSVIRSYRRLLSNAMLHTPQLPDPVARPDSISTHTNQDQSGDLVLSNGMVREPAPEHEDQLLTVDGEITDENSDHVTDSINDDVSIVDDVGWKEVDVDAVMRRNSQSDGFPSPETSELQPASVTDPDKPEVVSLSTEISFSESLTSEMEAMSDVVCHDKITTTMLPTTMTTSDEQEGRGMDDRTSDESVPDSPGPGSSGSADLQDLSSSAAGSNDGEDDGRRLRKPCRWPSSDRDTPSPTPGTADRGSSEWRRTDGKRNREAVKRSQAGLHCPPPLPPPPPATVVSASARTGRRQR